jgi:hypothetical protein
LRGFFVSLAHPSIIAAMTDSDWFLNLQIQAYRVGSYVVLHVLDDPAWLALIFC